MANAGPGPSPSAAPLDVDPRSAIPLAVAFAGLLTTAWLVRSASRTLTSLAIALLLTLALEPLVEALRRRTRWPRRFAVGAVLAAFAALIAVALLAMLPATIRQVRHLDREIPRVVEDLDDLPLVGDDLREADAPEKVREWLDELPERLSVDAKPIERAANTITDGVAAVFLTLLLAVTLLLDGERLVQGLRGLVPPPRRPQADRIGGLVYDVLGRYVAGSLLVAALAGTAVLAASLALGVPLAPLIATWVAMTNLIPQVGGALGGIPFVLLGTTRGLGTGLACLVFFLTYQQTENHLIGPLIVGRAVHLSPPATMVAALVGVSAGGVVGALFAVPLLGAAKAVYLATRPEDFTDPGPSRPPPTDAPPPAG